MYIGEAVAYRPQSGLRTELYSHVHIRSDDSWEYYTTEDKRRQKIFFSVLFGVLFGPLVLLVLGWCICKIISKLVDFISFMWKWGKGHIKRKRVQRRKEKERKQKEKEQRAIELAEMEEPGKRSKPILGRKKREPSSHRAVRDAFLNKDTLFEESEVSVDGSSGSVDR